MADRVGLGLLAAAVAWVVLSAIVVGGGPVPAALVLLVTATAVAAGRVGAGLGRALVPGAVVAMALVLMALSPVGTFSAAPVAGPLGYANAKAAFFVQAAVAALLLVAVLRRPAPRFGATVLAVAFAAVPLASDARAASASLLVVAAVSLAGALRAGRAAVLGAAAAFAVVLAGTIGIAATRSTPPELAAEVRALDAVRVQLWREAYDLMTEHPVLGVGPGRFDEASPTAGIDPDTSRAHHGFLQQGAETGVPGLVLAVALFGWAFVRLWRAPAEPAVRALGAAAVAALGIAASVDFVLQFHLVPIAAGLLVGTTTAGERPGPVGRPLRVAHVATVDSTVRFLLMPQLRRLRDERYEVAAISAPGPWTPGVEAEGIRHIPWPSVTRSWSPVRDVRAFIELLGILRRERFDLIHTHTPKPGILGRVAGRLVGAPAVVNTVHGLYATPEDPLAKRLAVLGVEAAAARLSDAELYQSEEDLAWAGRRRVVSAGRGVLLGNGTDVERFDPAAVDAARIAALRRELGLAPDHVAVGTVGRIVAEKGYRELLAAIHEVRRSRPEVRLLIVGETDEDKTDAIRRDELSAAGPEVIVAGWREDVRDLLAVMDVFVLASWREGVPRSAIEAAAMARPLVLTDVRGCREVVRDGVEGLLVPVRDPSALASAIETLVTDPSLRARLGRAARARAVARFDEARVEERILEVYERVLGTSRPSPVAAGVA